MTWAPVSRIYPSPCRRIFDGAGEYPHDGLWRRYRAAQHQQNVDDLKIKPIRRERGWKWFSLSHEGREAWKDIFIPSVWTGKSAAAAPTASSGAPRMPSVCRKATGKDHGHALHRLAANVSAYVPIIMPRSPIRTIWEHQHL